MSTEAADLIEALPVPALLIGRDERLTALNGLARQLLGDRAVGWHYVSALRQPQLVGAIEEVFHTGERRVPRYRIRQGERDIEYDVHCALTPSGMVVASFLDAGLEEQVSQIRRDFVANVSHELRTPLTALLGFIETLRGPAREDAKARDRFLGVMETEANRMVRLVGDLLSLSRVESEERLRPRDRIDLAGLCRSCLNGLAPLAEDAQVTLVPDLPEGAVMVPGDSDQLRQVLTNLLENAIKYGGEAGRVVLRLTGPTEDPGLRGPAVRLVVEDSGPGIDPLHIPRLTERFYRVDSHRSRQMGGTGLGLAIVKHIVSRHRGRLRIESEPGKGSRFSVTLPA
ncbi:sensor histidine kinase [Mesobacterium pallidum]|uniref:sensor histidine kinase n=1 Tax=Mesobacterium pallidum TaxID=2872037 RepID=UPI001EE33412|nr:ATP-binding protein [Mesobacterium pallidum]